MEIDGKSGSGYKSSALDVRRLSLFVAVVDEGGFSRAAQAVHISQPALSQAIAELEAELGGPLFHRLGRRVTLTEAGQALLGPGRQVLRQLEAARQATAQITGLSRGRLDVSALRTLCADPLPALLGPFCATYPHVEVRIASPDDPAELVEHVRNGVAEVGVTDADHVGSGLVTVPLGLQRLQAVFPPGTSALSGPVSAGELSQLRLILTPPGTSGRDLLDHALAAGGFRANVVIETSQREAILPLVLCGAGVAVLPEAMTGIAAAAGAVAIDIDPALVRPLAVVHRPGALTPPAAALLKVAASLISA